MTQTPDDAFFERREKQRSKLDALPGNYADNPEERNVFFNAVYEEASGDEALVPWADLKAKPHLLEFLAKHNGEGKTALDIACGLGDNAEAMARHGYQTTAFDVVEKAIFWAKKRFSESSVDYQVQDLFMLPKEWQGKFDLVHECFTLQALPEAMVEQSFKAIMSLVANNGTLLIYTRYRDDGTKANGPPWPLEEKWLTYPEGFGFTLIEEQRFIIEKPDRKVPHCFSIWRKP